MSAAQVFGYTKSDLMNRKVNMLMPQIYSDYHDKFIEDFLHTLEGRVLNKERTLLGKTKSGYLIPHYNYTRVINPNFI